MNFDASHRDAARAVYSERAEKCLNETERLEISDIAENDCVVRCRPCFRGYCHRVFAQEVPSNNSAPIGCAMNSRCPKYVLWAGLALLAMAFFAMTANGQETSLVGINRGSDLTTIARRLERGGYELTNGTWVPLSKMYHSNWVDMQFEMLTQLSDDFGLLWGASTGQRAEKVRIDPDVQLGFIVQKRPTPSTTLTFTANSILGGDLTEQPCTASYRLGGVQKVNCRLAASELPVADTLKHLVKLHPSRLKLSLWFRGQF
ncbi:hypothetical protein [Rhizobium jaguaris]|uniref:hypothetical protein n=1 Tax=Rhizobium jaguaris TaxID=1312183 RepID=UPI001FE15CCB|nr:hypothetical protein [Rhizobium jaguaris]